MPPPTDNLAVFAAKTVQLSQNVLSQLGKKM
jgi:hypothetical protein